MPWMISPARRPSLRMSARMARTSSSLGVGLCRCSSAESVLTIMAPSGWFNSCASEPEISPSVVTRERCATSLRWSASSCSACLRFGDVHHNTARQDRFAAGVELDVPAGRHPAHRAVGQLHAMLRIVRSIARKRPLDRFIAHSKVLRMYPRAEHLHGQAGVRGITEQLFAAVARPKVVAGNIPHPEAQAHRVRGEGHSFFILTSLSLPRGVGGRAARAARRWSQPGQRRRPGRR